VRHAGLLSASPVFLHDTPLWPQHPSFTYFWLISMWLCPPPLTLLSMGSGQNR
jgi:hypothetical protein